MKQIELLIEDYERRVINITEMIKDVTQHPEVTERLKVKKGCYNTFIAELKRSIKTLEKKEIDKILKVEEHKCNEESVVYIDSGGKRYFFENPAEGHKWYLKTEENITFGSLACSICGT